MKQPHIIMDQASEITGISADDLVHLHYVRCGPDDLRAAHTQPLIAQVFSNLPLGSVHRMVMLDVEFHEHLPEREVSTSRRCMLVPRVLTRGVPPRVTGMHTYCVKARSRCLV